jgi:thioredoxin-dependent peroxiredoxin
MAAKKKIAPSKGKALAKPAKKTAAKPAKKTAAKPAKKAAAKPASKKAPPKAAKAAKPKPAKAASKPAKAAKPTKAASKPAKATKPAKAEAPSLAKTMRGAMAKIAAGAAEVATKLFDSVEDRTAPEFELTDDKGETVSSSALAGKPYLIYFYPKDDTPGCTKEACDLRDNFGRFGEQGLRVIGVSPDSQQSHAKFSKKYGLPFTLLSDPEKTLATAYGVWGMKNNYGKEYMGIIRSTFLIGADGKIKKAYRGVKVDGHVDAVLNDARALLD